MEMEAPSLRFGSQPAVSAVPPHPSLENIEAYNKAMAEADSVLDALSSGVMPDDMKNSPYDNPGIISEPLPPPPVDELPNEEEVISEDSSASVSDDYDDKNQNQDDDVPSLEDVSSEVMKKVGQYESGLYDKALEHARLLEQQNLILQQQLQEKNQKLQQVEAIDRKAFIKRLQQGLTDTTNNGDQEGYWKIHQALMMEYAKEAQSQNSRPTGSMSPYMPEMPKPVYTQPMQPPAPFYNQQPVQQQQWSNFAYGTPPYAPPLPPVQSYVYSTQPYQPYYPPHPVTGVPPQPPVTSQTPPGRKNADGSVAVNDKPKVVKNRQSQPLPKFHELERDLIEMTSYYDDKGKEITDFNEKARRYLRDNKHINTQA